MGVTKGSEHTEDFFMRRSIRIRRFSMRNSMSATRDVDGDSVIE